MCRSLPRTCLRSNSLWCLTPVQIIHAHLPAIQHQASVWTEVSTNATSILKVGVASCRSLQSPRNCCAFNLGDVMMHVLGFLKHLKQMPIELSMISSDRAHVNRAAWTWTARRAAWAASPGLPVPLHHTGWGWFGEGCPRWKQAWCWECRTMGMSDEGSSKGIEPAGWRVSLRDLPLRTCLHVEDRVPSNVFLGKPSLGPRPTVSYSAELPYNTPPWPNSSASLVVLASPIRSIWLPLALSFRAPKGELKRVIESSSKSMWRF